MRFLAVLAFIALLGAACGNDSSDSNSGTSSTTEAENSTTTLADDNNSDEPENGDDDADERSISLSAYWLDENNELRVGYTHVVAPGSPGADIVNALLDGPLDEDVELGLRTALPTDARLRSLDIIGSEVIADFSAEFAAGDDSLEAQARLAQVVYTLTQFPVVEAIEILIEGQPEATMGDSGIVIKPILARSDFEWDGEYETFAPTVLVESPRPGQLTAGNGVEVAGSAFTFEGALYLEAISATGEVLAPETYFMTDVDGENMKGTFSVWLDFDSDLLGDITLRAYDLSAESGEPTGVVEVPIVRAG